MRKQYERWVYDALKDNNGSATVLEVSKHIWANHKEDIDGTEDFYSCKYDFRWGATELRKKGIMRDAKESPRGLRQLKDNDLEFF